MLPLSTFINFNALILPKTLINNVLLIQTIKRKSCVGGTFLVCDDTTQRMDTNIRTLNVTEKSKAAWWIR